MKNFKILILTLGSPSKSYHKDIISLSKKNSKFPIDILHLKKEQIPPDPSDTQILSILESEGEVIEKVLKKSDYVIALDIDDANARGCTQIPLSANPQKRLKQALQSAKNLGKTRLVFLVGSSYGMSEKTKKSADFILSFGKITLNHQIVPPIIIKLLNVTL